MGDCGMLLDHIRCLAFIRFPVDQAQLGFGLWPCVEFSTPTRKPTFPQMTINRVRREDTLRPRDETKHFKSDWNPPTECLE